MNREEIIRVLGDNLGKVVCVTSSKGIVQYLTVVNLDDCLTTLKMFKAISPTRRMFLSEPKVDLFAD
jgi:hypothetical protein